MKIRELIELLQALPQDHDVVMSSDSEGNSYSPLRVVAEAHYRPETPCSGVLDEGESAADVEGESEWDDEEEDDGEGDGEEEPPPPNAVVFWPAN